MAARARLLGAVGLRQAVHVAQGRQRGLQVQLRALRQVRLRAEDTEDNRQSNSQFVGNFQYKPEKRIRA